MLEQRSTLQDGSWWYYAPNKGAPIAFAILFAVSGIYHFYQCFKLHAWKVTGLLPWSALLFVIGFILRAFGAFGHWDNLNVFIASAVFLLAGPPVYEAANFLTLGRILYYIPYHSPIHPGRVFTTFLALGVVIEAITANGAAFVANMSNSQSQQDTGKILIKAALILQLFQMAAFIALALRFYSNCRRGHVLNSKVQRALHVLLASCTLITIRTIYRTVEYFTAANLNFTDPANISPILKQEWFFWVFEAAIMFANTSMLNVFHPLKSLPKSNKIYLAKDGVTEVEGPGFQDRRNFLLTLIDPFDVIGMIFRTRKHEKFWEEGDAGRNAATKRSQSSDNV